MTVNGPGGFTVHTIFVPMPVPAPDCACACAFDVVGFVHGWGGVAVDGIGGLIDSGLRMPMSSMGPVVIRVVFGEGVRWCFRAFA